VVDAVRDPVPVPVPVPVSPLESSLIHRYSFSEGGALALDSKGAAHGQVIGTKLLGTGELALAGLRTGQYVDLPNGIVSGLQDATFEAWLTWNGGGAWQRIFDFGDSTSGEDMPAGGSSYIFLTTASSNDTVRGPATLRVAYSRNGVADEEVCNGSKPLPTNTPTHVAVVVNPSTETMALYQDGALLSECPLTRPLAKIEDVNNWLGHSNFSADEDLNASYDEFRIYGAALTASEIADSFAAGPDAKP
jgi:Concanavalin A-like lectin/glucanases superfamily